MNKTVLVAGTASHVGKSTIVAGLCRLLARRNVSVAPFKAQNMSNNARVTLSPDGSWGEIGVSQYVQAQAAMVPPSTDLNPVLLKPRGNEESQLVIHGEARTHLSAGRYYEDHWEKARQAAIESYQRLANAYDVIIAEGAGSIAEINLHERDLANVETAEFTDARIVIAVDIERGGAFASLYGTIELMPERLRDQVAGAVITKFRGDESLLDPGIKEIESRTGVPIVGILPYEDPGLPAEDSVSLPPEDTKAVVGDEDEIPDSDSVIIGVPRLPRISNFTDLEPLSRVPGVRIAYLPLDARIDGCDAIVIPGSKNTVDDLLVAKKAGFGEALRDFQGPVVGLCGGYQMLGERITNAAIEGTTQRDAVDGFGLLPVDTRFSTDKHVECVSLRLEGSGPLAGASGIVTGYEIHMGRTTVKGSLDRPLGKSSCATDWILGTYLHGLFENAIARTAFVEAIHRYIGSEPPTEWQTAHSPHDAAADLLKGNLDLSYLDLPG